MNKHEIEPPLTHALDKNGNLKYVRDVPIGDACGCICPKCKEPLIAKHCYNEGKLPHFAHVSGKVCIGAQMSALHLRAQQIIVDKLYVRAPGYRRIKAGNLRFVKVQTEDTRWEGIRPDVVGETADNNVWAIEIFYTNKVNYLKEDKIKNLNISCLEIDISSQTYESLELFLLKSSKNRWWINNPVYDKMIDERDRALLRAVTASLLLEKELVIPKFDSISSKRLIITSNTIVPLALRGLCSIVKITSSDNNEYYFIIGSSEILNRLDYDYIARFHNSNVLSVCTDNYIQSGYKFDWIYWNEKSESLSIQVPSFNDTVVQQPRPKVQDVLYNVKKSGEGEIFVCKPQKTGGENGVFSKPFSCESIEDFFYFIDEKGKLNWNGNDNYVDSFILSKDKNELYVLHYYTRDLCYLTKFTWQKFNYLAETNSGTYENLYNEMIIIKDKMNVCP